MLIAISILKALLEVAALALLGQGLLYLLAGKKRERNVVYHALQTITRPIHRLTRLVTPRLVLDRHIGLVAFLLVAMGWYFTLLEKQAACIDNLTETACRPLLEEYARACADGQEPACRILERNKLPGRPLSE